MALGLLVGMTGTTWAGVPLDNTFTYQGLLRLSGENVNELADLRFLL
jgi:hypothetical protein